VPVESFKADLETYLYKTRTVGEWDQFFSTIKAGTLDQEEIGLAASEATEVARERAITGGSVSPRNRTAYKRTRQQVEAEHNTFGSFDMIEGGDVESSMNSIGDLQHQMNFLVKKVKKTEMSQMTYPSDEADRSIVGLRNLVGS
jgi:hypothetical protein